MRWIKGQRKKGSVPRHIMSILNFTLAQPMLYTYLSTRLKGGLMWLIDDDDDEPTEADKTMKSALILRNNSSLPVMGPAIG
ncbi:hypothetical protein [Sinomicrobium sp. M5D2P17]